MWPRCTRLTLMINYSRGNCIPCNVGRRRSPAVACWASDHFHHFISNPLRGKFRHSFLLIIPGVCLAQFSLNNVHKGGLKHHHFISGICLSRFDQCRINVGGIKRHLTSVMTDWLGDPQHFLIVDVFPHVAHNSANGDLKRTGLRTYPYTLSKNSR